MFYKYLIRTFETNNKHLLSLNIKRRKMKITQIRENGDTEALSVTDIDLLIEKMKKETKLRPVTGLRQALHFVLPDEPCSLANKLQWHCRTDHRSASRKDRGGNREAKGSRTSPNNAGFYGSKW